jgi:polyhydroxyalkanoate synthesis regulator phasin
MLLGMGVAALSWDKIHSGIDDLVSRGDITADEGKKLLEEFSSRAEQEGRTINERIRSQAKEIMKDMGVVESLRIDALESRVQALEDRMKDSGAESDRID